MTYKKVKTNTVDFLYDWIIHKEEIIGYTRFRQGNLFYYKFYTETPYKYELSFYSDNAIKPGFSLDALFLPNFLYWNKEKSILYHAYYKNSYEKPYFEEAMHKENIDILKIGFLNEDLDFFIFYLDNNDLVLDIFNSEYVLQDTFNLGAYTGIYNLICKKIDDIIYAGNGFLENDIYKIKFTVIENSVLIYNQNLLTDTVAFFDFEKRGNKISIALLRGVEVISFDYNLLLNTIDNPRNLFSIPSVFYPVGNNGYFLRGGQLVKQENNLAFYIYGNSLFKITYSESESAGENLQIINNSEPFNIFSFKATSEDISFLTFNKLSILKPYTHIKEYEYPGVLNYDFQNAEVLLKESKINFKNYLLNGREIKLTEDGKTLGYSSI